MADVRRAGLSDEAVPPKGKKKKPKMKMKLQLQINEPMLTH